MMFIIDPMHCNGERFGKEEFWRREWWLVTMMKVMMIITKMTQGECGEGHEGGDDYYQDDPG